MSKTDQKIRNLEIHLDSVVKKRVRLQEVEAQVRTQIQILQKQKQIQVTIKSVSTGPPIAITHQHQIEADAGTSRNVPPLYGNGYGSYKIDDRPIVSRVQFGSGHSNNSAEITAIIHALRALRLITDASNAEVLIRSDSKIALKWCTATEQPKENTSSAFRSAIALLRFETEKFKKIKTQWRGRQHSVNLFGH